MVSRKPLAALHCSLDYKPLLQEPSRLPLGSCFGVYNRGMKPLPPPHVSGKTEFERFDNATRQVLSVTKEELLRRESTEKKARERKRRPKK